MATSPSVIFLMQLIILDNMFNKYKFSAVLFAISGDLMIVFNNNINIKNENFYLGFFFILTCCFTICLYKILLSKYLIKNAETLKLFLGIMGLI